MDVIFLDIDGVLNRLGSVDEGRTKTRWNGYIGMEPLLIVRFNRILNFTGANVVLSSTWRLDKDWYLTMAEHGLNVKHFIGRTKDLPTRFRGDEIKEWLDTHDEIRKYAILDDDGDFYPNQKLFRTSYKDGLTEEISEDIIKYIKS